MDNKINFLINNIFSFKVLNKLINRNEINILINYIFVNILVGFLNKYYSQPQYYVDHG